MGTLGNNGLIMKAFIDTKQIIHLSGPVDETSFFARDRLILVLGQKGDLTTCYPQIIWYARLQFKYANMYLFIDKAKFQPWILWGKSIPHWGNFGVIWPCLTPGIFGMLC